MNANENIDTSIEVTVRTHHVDITPALKAYAKKKLEKLCHFFENIQAITIELDIINDTHDQVAMGTIWAPGTILRASESSGDMYSSIDLVESKLRTQLTRYKEKIQDHRKDRKVKREMEYGSGSKPAKRSVKKNEEPLLYKPKPMGVEDASEYLSENDLNFFVFNNMDTGKINVIYPIGDYEFGLIEP